MRYYLGIDLGGTSMKTALFDERGNVVSAGARQLSIETPGHGMQQRDMQEMWQQSARLISDIVAKSGICAEKIRAVSFSAYGKGLCMIDAAGKPVGKAILSTDSRAQTYVNQWKNRDFMEIYRPCAMQDLDACQPLCLLKWVQQKKPEQLQQAKYLLGAKDYIRFCMTGDAYFERTDFSGSGLCDIKTGQLSQEVLRAAGLEECLEKLPPVIASHSPAGRVCKEAAALTGLKEGTLCAAGVFDIDACALAMNVVDERSVAIIAGTWGINEYISPILCDRPGCRNSLYVLPGYYLVESSAPTSASNLDWFVKTVLDREGNESWGYTEANRLAQDGDRKDSGTLYLPFIHGNGGIAGAGACFVGMDTRTTLSELTRSVMEGVAFCHRSQVERLGRNTADMIRLCGGICNSPLWVQIFADVLNMPVEAMEGSYTGALGAAMVGAVACGDQPDLYQAAAQMAPERHVVVPRQGALYEEKYQKYQEIVSALTQV